MRKKLLKIVLPLMICISFLVPLSASADIATTIPNDLYDWIKGTSEEIPNAVDMLLQPNVEWDNRDLWTRNSFKLSADFKID